MKIEYNPSTSTFSLWAALLGNATLPDHSGLNIVGHAIMSGNYSTSVAFVYYDGLAYSQDGGSSDVFDVIFELLSF